MIIEFFQKTNKFLKNNDQLFFTYGDKSSTTVCIEKVDYVSKVNDLLKDQDTYEVIDIKPCCQNCRKETTAY